MPTPRPHRTLLTGLLALLLAAAVGAQPAAADPGPAPRDGTCGDDGCWQWSYQFVRVDKVLTGLGRSGVGDPISFLGQVSCVDWLEPDYFQVEVAAGTSRGTGGVWIKQLEYTSGARCTVSELDPDGYTTDRYAVVGPTTLSPAAFDEPSWQTVTDEDHPLLTITSTTPLRAATVAGTAWRDDDRDGHRDAGEAGVGGIEVRLAGHGGLAHPTAATTTTRADGSYAFAGLSAGPYSVSFPSLPRQRWGSPATGTTSTFVLAPGETRRAVDQTYVRQGTAMRPPRDR